MKALALVLCVLTVVRGQDCGPGGLQKFYSKIRDFTNSDDNPFKDELDEHEGALNQLVARLGVVFQNADRALDNAKEYADVLNDLEADIEGLEGTGCPDYEFNCHDDFGHCIDKVLVCDGVADCDGGYDEAESTCTNVFTEGSVWEGHFVYDHCTQRQPESMKISIYEVHPQNYMSSDAVVEANVFLSAHHRNEHAEANFRLHGDYYYGTKRLVFQPPEDDRLGIIIQYDGHHSKDATGWIVRENSLDRCAEIVFHRVD